VVDIGRQGVETCVRRVGQKRLLFSTVRAWRSQGRGFCGTNSEFELESAPSSSLFRSSTSSARRSPVIASASSLRKSFLSSPSRDELVLRAESPAARPSWGVEPAASIARRRRASEPQLPRQASTGGCPRRRGGAKSAMNGELSSDATPLANGPWVGGLSSPGCWDRRLPHRPRSSEATLIM
jgi:hypothetical protein